LADGHADPGHTRGVRHGQFVAVAKRDFRVDFDLAAEVEQEGAVGDFADVDPVQFFQGVDDLVGVGGVGGVTGEVDQHPGRVGIDHVQGGDDGVGLAHARGKPADGRGVSGDGDADRDRESCAGHTGGHHGIPSVGQ
jgi:hypothetical protein